MKTHSVILLIVVLLTSIIIGERVSIKGFYANMDKEINMIKESASNGIIDENNFEKIKKIWDKNKSKIYVFKNHNEYSEYDNNISEMYYAIENKDNEKLYYSAFKLLDMNKRIKESGDFNLCNIF